MIYKKNGEKQNGEYFRYIVFILLFLYSIGVCSGCLFTFKNSDNLNYVKYIVAASEITDFSYNEIFLICTKYFLKVFIYFLTVLTLKYSGILGPAMVLTVIVAAVQNAVIYCVNLIENSGNFLYVIFFFSLKDTAIILLLIIYISININNIINGKYKIKLDIKQFSIYILGVAAICIIDCIIKLIMSNGLI